MINSAVIALKEEIAIIGSGVVGLGTAWFLASQGYQVILLDPKVKNNLAKPNNESGTNASLGVLMGNTFQRSTGRGWRLRERSIKLWPDWVEKLNTNKTPLNFEKPLVKIATSQKEKAFLDHLIKTRQNHGIREFNDEENYFYKKL